MAKKRKKNMSKIQHKKSAVKNREDEKVEHPADRKQEKATNYWSVMRNKG